MMRQGFQRQKFGRRAGNKLRPSFFCGDGFSARGGGGFLEAVAAAKLLAKPLHAAGGVNKLLLSSEKRMAGTADIDVDLLLRAAGDKRISTGAVNVAVLVTGVNLRFHEAQLLFERDVREVKSIPRQPAGFRGVEQYQVNRAKAIELSFYRSRLIIKTLLIGPCKNMQQIFIGSGPGAEEEAPARIWTRASDSTHLAGPVPA